MSLGHTREQNGPPGANRLEVWNETTLGPLADDKLGGKYLLSGMPKDAFFVTLAEVVERLQIRFPVVFLEACRSQLGDERTGRLVASPLAGYVGVVFASDDTGLLYSTVDYAELFGSVGDDDGQSTLATALANYLADYRQRQDEIRAGVAGQLPAT